MEGGAAADGDEVDRRGGLGLVKISDDRDSVFVWDEPGGIGPEGVTAGPEVPDCRLCLTSGVMGLCLTSVGMGCFCRGGNVEGSTRTSGSMAAQRASVSGRLRGTPARTSRLRHRGKGDGVITAWDIPVFYRFVTFCSSLTRFRRLCSTQNDTA